jgi:hypothetical protein
VLLDFSATYFFRVAPRWQAPQRGKRIAYLGGLPAGWDELGLFGFVFFGPAGGVFGCNWLLLPVLRWFLG